tara:strand:- start:588 stop:785 length:198 start_codon:yes stop_codon:yes gene_type:complete
MKCKKHHYILEEPSGKKAWGICKYCSKKKLHYNFNEKVVKRVVRDGAKATNTVGIVLKGSKKDLM